MPVLGASAESSTVFCDYTYDQRVMVMVSSAGGGQYMLVAADDSIGLYDTKANTWVGKLSW